MPRIQQQTLIALYGEVLTAVEAVELLAEEIGQALALADATAQALAIGKASGTALAVARKAQARAVDVLLDKFPTMEIHPLTGDVLDPPQG